MKKVTALGLKKMLDGQEDIFLINVLDREAFEKRHIPGSVNIPLKDEEFLDKVEERTDYKSKEVVVYCANTECEASPKAAKVLEDAGYTNVYDFEAGMKGWQESGYEVCVSGDVNEEGECEVCSG